jgi:hypothetical protein
VSSEAVISEAPKKAVSIQVMSDRPLASGVTSD